MAIGIDYVQPLSFQQNNPVLGGMQMGQQMITNALQQQLLKTQNQYMPAQYQADIGLKNAQTGLVGAQTQFFPITAQGQYLRGMGDYLRGMYMNNPAMWASRFQNNPSFQAMIAQNPDLAKSFANVMGNAVVNPMALMNNMMGGMPGMMPPMMQAQGAPTANMQQGAPMQQSQGMPAQSPSAPMPLPLSSNQIQALNNADAQMGFAPTNQDVQTVQQTAGDKAIKDTTTSQVMNQRQYATLLDGLFNQAQNLMPSVANYAGLKGGMELKGEKIATGLGFPASNDYQNYLNFTRNVAPTMANELRRALGGQATDSERQVMENIANPLTWDSNPTTAMNQFNQLVNLYKSQINPALASGSNQVRAQLTNPSEMPPTSTSGMTKTLGGNTYIKMNGKWYQQ